MGFLLYLIHNFIEDFDYVLIDHIQDLKSHLMIFIFMQFIQLELVNLIFSHNYL